MAEVDAQPTIDGVVGTGMSNKTLVASFPELDPMATSTSLRATLKSTDELKKQRDSRAAEALRMKDEQLRILSDQNAQLLGSLDRVEEEANNIQLEKIAVEQENRSLRDQNFELQSKVRAAEAIARKAQTDIADRDKQLKILTEQNTELLRLLENEEQQNARFQAEAETSRTTLEEYKRKQAALVAAAKSHEELAIRAAREGQLRADEIRVLRAETEQLRQQNNELRMKTQVEVDALQEQLRVRKEKQYQLLERLQSHEEGKRQAEDQVVGMEDRLRQLHARTMELETQLQVEQRMKQSLEESNKQIQVELSSIAENNRELQAKIDKSEKERLRMEAEARDSGDQLREMAEKVFQLLERLKLAELGKTKAVEALKKKEQDMIVVQKKNARLIKESTEEARARIKAEMDIKALQEQVRALKKHNSALAAKSKEEAKEKLKVEEDNTQLEERTKTLEARLAFLLNKVQVDEESRMVSTEDRKRMEAQIEALTLRGEELQAKLEEAAQSNRVISQALRQKNEEYDTLSARYDALQTWQQEQEAASSVKAGTEYVEVDPSAPDAIDQVRANDGRGRFYVESKASQNTLLLRARKPAYKDWLDRHDVNGFLKRAQKTSRVREALVEKLATVYGLLMVEEEHRKSIEEEVTMRNNHVEFLQQKHALMQKQLSTEEEAKRRMLLRYVQAVKDHATQQIEVNGQLHHAVLQLPESSITDEEVHALVALLRNNIHIEEANLRGNSITDDGARAFAALLSGRSGLKLLDLRGNKISRTAVKILAESLERSDRVRHVYVHAGGKIEALGTGVWNPTTAVGSGQSDAAVAAPMITVETVCVVDVRDNQPDPVPQTTDLELEQMQFNKSSTYDFMTSKTGSFMQTGSGGMSASVPTFTPASLLNTDDGQRGASRKAKKRHSPGKPNTNLSAADRGFAVSADDAELNASRRSKEQLKMQALEAAWQGRQGGLDLSAALGRKSLPPLQDLNLTELEIGDKEDGRVQSAPTNAPSTLDHAGLELMQSSDDERGMRNESRGGQRQRVNKQLDPKLAGSPFLQSIRPKKGKR